VIEQVEPIFNYDVLYIGGGNAKKLTGELPPSVHLFGNVEGMTGGIRLWNDDVQQAELQGGESQSTA
jgi:polyphosphate glucokinase